MEQPGVALAAPRADLGERLAGRNARLTGVFVRPGGGVVFFGADG